MRLATIGFCLAALASSAYSSVLMAEPIPVRYSQGSSHGFVALKTLDGKIIATGESTQTVSRGKVSSRLVFGFKDGSVDDDGTVFTQQGFFRLISDHHIQRGPSFPKAINFLIDMEHIDRLSQPLLRLSRMSATASVSGSRRRSLDVTRERSRSIRASRAADGAAFATEIPSEAIPFDRV